MGLLAARLPELDLEAVADPRAREGRWSLAQILRATLVGLMAGCRSLWEAEQLTASLSVAARRQLGLKRRLADTTARDALCKVPLEELRAALHRLVKTAWRRKALQSQVLPIQWWRSTARRRHCRASISVSYRPSTRRLGSHSGSSAR
jgi:hypothetical protein